MQRTDIVALVAGTTVGMGGAFLICTAGRALTLHLLDPCYDHGKQAPLTPRPGAEQAGQADRLETHLTCGGLQRSLPRLIPAPERSHHSLV